MPSKPGSEDCENQRRIVWRCGSCQKYHAMAAGCKKLSCSTCYDVTRVRRSKAVRKRIGSIRAPWGVVVLTIPMELRARAQGVQLEELRREGRKLIDSWYRRRSGCKSSLWQVGSGEWTHPAGDRTDGWAPHFNFITPLVAISPGWDAVERIPEWATERELGVLRRGWRRVLARVLDATIRCEVDVFYEYRKSRKQKWHATKYFSRPFPEWASTGVNKTRWYGFLGNQGWQGKLAWLKSVGMVNGYRVGEDDDIAPLCPDCGDAMSFVSMFDTVDELEEWLRDDGSGSRAGPKAA